MTEADILAISSLDLIRITTVLAEKSLLYYDIYSQFSIYTTKTIIIRKQY
jgi:hypothetical protein